MERAIGDRGFYKDLLSSIQKRRALFAPAEERRALLGVVRETLTP
jgi:hypothetical protein